MISLNFPLQFTICTLQYAIRHSENADGGILHRRLGILGGTFNPVHYGHLAAAEEIHDRLKLDQVLFIPSFSASP